MRWKITSREVSEDTNSGTRTTKTKKQFVMTIGEAVGVGKTAYGAAQSVVSSLSSLTSKSSNINSTVSSGKNKLITAGKAGLSGAAKAMVGAASATAATLMAMVTTFKAYGMIMQAIELATPIASLVALVSGILFSPGNIIEIIEIALGLAQSALITLAASLVIKLKDLVWNYEFSLKEITETMIEPIEKNIQSMDKQVKEKVADILNHLAEKSSENSDGSDSKKNADAILSTLGSGELNLANSIDWNSDSDKRWFSDGYITEYSVSENKRILRGSLKNYGIQYSDDNGTTWNSTSQETGKWTCFAKIKNGENYIYLAGGKDYVSSVKESSDKSFTENKNYYYYDGENYLPLSKSQKENAEKILDKETYVASGGIYISEDNGLTWEPTSITDNINCLTEFSEKDGAVASVVAASDDFKGVYYTSDGKNFSNTFTTEKWLTIKAFQATIKRAKFNALNILANLKVKFSTGKAIKGTNTFVNFSGNMENVMVADARDSDTADYFEKLANLAKQGLTPAQIKKQIGSFYGK